MKKSLITLLVTGLLAANAQAAGQDNTWYGGAKLGWSNFYGIDESNALTLGNETNDALGAGVFWRLSDQQESGTGAGLRLSGQLQIRCHYGGRRFQ